MIGCCVLLAAVAAVASTHAIGVLPPKLTPRALDVATAQSRASVDRPRPLVRDGRATTGDYESAQQRAVLVANLMTARTGLASIARRAGLDPRDIAALAPVTIGVQRAFNEPDSERRADQIAGAAKPYRLEVRADPEVPTLHVYAQAPSVVEARRLADAAVPGMEDHLRTLARRERVDFAQQLSLYQLGRARGAVVNTGTRPKIAALTFAFVLTVALLSALVISRWRRGRRRGPGDLTSASHGGGVAIAGCRAPNGAAGGSDAPAFAPVPQPTGASALAAARPAPRTVRSPTTTRLAATSSLAARRSGDWPRTTRPLPWMIALLIAVVWLVPFNDIMLGAISLPIDLYLDRLILPVIIAVWLLLLAAGGPEAPRLRLTWIHVALAGIVGVACLSVLLEASAINRALEFDLAFKKLVLLVSYVSLFVIVASSVRRTEIRAFLTYTLLLAVACALGTLVEYRFQTNIFYSFADSVLPGAFQVGNVDPVGVDEIGRREVRGPAQTPLEVVAMLSMALPIAVVRLLQSRRTLECVVYLLGAAVLLAAVVATFRKSAFLAPISVCLTLAYLLRHHLVKLAPLGVVVVLMVQVLAPGALTGVAGQLESDKLGVTTVSDRAADYDAIRPDVWSHVVIGRGYGSYETSSYRILDMELLRQLIEGGVLGLLAYVLMAVTVVAVAHRLVRARAADDAPVALVAAAAAVCFLTVSALFDVMSFPHVPYTFLWVAALLAIVSESAFAPEPVAARSAPIPRLALEPAWRW